MTNKPLPKRIPAFAIEMLTQHPLALTLPAAGFGMLTRLIFHFIATNCRPIPPEGDDLRGIMRAHRGTWTQHRESILAVFRELEPQLIEAEQAYRRRLQRVKDLGEKGRVSQRLRALKETPPRSKPADPMQITTPKRAPITQAPRPFPNPGDGWT
jgi:hypothetical protein